MARSANEISNGQRALWTFLGATLIGPFIGALAILGLTLAAGLFGFGPPSLKNLAAGQLGPIAAQRTLEAYLWGAFPAALAGAISAAWLSLRGALPWLVAACAGAVAVTLAAVLLGGQVARDHISALAFIAATAGVVVWLILRRARIISDVG
jgi:hypothetical protein